MLNNRKIRLMAKLAVYETKEGREDISLSKYYKTDYVRYQAIKSMISATVGFLLILVLVLIYKSEYIVRYAVTMDYKTIGAYLLAAYILVIALYGLISLAWYSMKYDTSHKKLARYFKLLKRLQKIYNEETPET